MSARSELYVIIGISQRTAVIIVRESLYLELVEGKQSPDILTRLGQVL
jgi:hypothetical protein